VRIERPARAWTRTGINNTSTYFFDERGAPLVLRWQSAEVLPLIIGGRLRSRRDNPGREPILAFSRRGVGRLGWRRAVAPVLALKSAIRDSAETPTGVDRIDQTCYHGGR
jgi:hypothetical protein